MRKQRIAVISMMVCCICLFIFLGNRQAILEKINQIKTSGTVTDISGEAVAATSKSPTGPSDDEDITPEKMAEMKKKAEQSEVKFADGFEQPEMPERVEYLTYEKLDYTNDTSIDTFFEELLKDNPENRTFNLRRVPYEELLKLTKLSDVGEEYLYTVIKDGNNFNLTINRYDNIDMKSWKWKDIKKEDVLEKVSSILDFFDYPVAPKEKWSVTKENTVADYGINEKNYVVNVPLTYNGVDFLKYAPEYIDDENAYNSLTNLEFCYGEKGWLSISIENPISLKGTGEYVDTFMTVQEVADSLLETFKNRIAQKIQVFEIRHAQLGYFFVSENTVGPVWYLDGLYKGKHWYFLVNPETGEILQEDVSNVEEYDPVLDDLED